MIHEPEPLVSGLAGRRVSGELVDRLPAMIAELRAMDDVAGGGDVLTLAQDHFCWVAGLLDQASYDDATGRKLHRALAELGKLVGWTCYESGQHGLAQRYHIAGLRAAHVADDSKGLAAIQLAESLSSTLCVDRIRDLARLMKPHTKLPAVRDFVERAHGL